MYFINCRVLQLFFLYIVPGTYTQLGNANFLGTEVQFK